MNCPYKKMKMSTIPKDDSEENEKYVALSTDSKATDQIKGDMEPNSIANNMDFEDDPMSDDDMSYTDMREFAILDEVNDSDEEEAESGYKESDSETELEPEEVEALLNTSDICVKERFDPYDFSSKESEKLPPDWVRKEYSAGIPFYVHVPTNIVSTTRPYKLGTGSIKKHKLCINAIPCLDYARRQKNEKEVEKMGQNDKKHSGVETGLISVDSVPVIGDTHNNEEVPISDNIAKTKVDTASKGEASVTVQDKAPLNQTPPDPGDGAKSVTKCHADSVQNNSGNFMTNDEAVKYFKKLYKYKTIKMRKFSSWKMKRAFVHKQKCQNKITKNIPAAPEGTLVISVPMLNTRTNKLESQDWSLNPKGKSYVCILHEYLQRAVKTHPVYEFKELENAKTPYLATIKLNDMLYGSGIGSSKRIAKLEAAKATLEILLPQLKELWKKGDNTSTPATATVPSVINDEDKYSLFDTVKITDPKVTQYCRALGEAAPYAMLQTCIEKNFDEDVQEIRQSSKPIGKDKILFTMEVEGYTASVKCSSKKEGQQLASQMLLQQLHPQVHYLGSQLRLYGNAVLKGVKEKKAHGGEGKVPKKKDDDSPNFQVLRELREAMEVIYKDRKYLLDEGGFVAPPDIDECVAVMYKEMKMKHLAAALGEGAVPEASVGDSETIPDPTAGDSETIPDTTAGNAVPGTETIPDPTAGSSVPGSSSSLETNSDTTQSDRFSDNSALSQDTNLNSRLMSILDPSSDNGIDPN